MRHLVAAAYLTAGWSVFPVTPGRKAPPLLPWTEFQTRLPEMAEIGDWWSRWPDANVAIATGKVSGISVVDVDAASGGMDSLKKSGWIPPRTRVHKTPAGFHLVYRYHPALHTGAAFLKGVDVRNDGGYIVAPPSVSEKGSYSVLPGRPVEPTELDTIPPWLVASKRKDEPKPTEPTWVVEGMRGVPEHQRNEMATRLVGYYHAKGLPRIVILELMHVFSRNCTPMMDERELQQTINSVLRYPSGAGKQNGWAGW